MTACRIQVLNFVKNSQIKRTDHLRLTFLLGFFVPTIAPAKERTGTAVCRRVEIRGEYPDECARKQSERSSIHAVSRMPLIKPQIAGAPPRSLPAVKPPKNAVNAAAISASGRMMLSGSGWKYAPSESKRISPAPMASVMRKATKVCLVKIAPSAAEDFDGVRFLEFCRVN